MEQNQNIDSPENPTKKPRARHGSRNGKNQPDAWQPPQDKQSGRRKKRPEGPQARPRARSGASREDFAPPGSEAEQPQADHPGAEQQETPAPSPLHADLPHFTPVPRKVRHDGWTPERQRAFIGALADTGCVSRAARYVNMSMEGAYWLRRQPGSDSFRAAWEAALNLGVQRLKDEVYERALEGQLHPVFVGGKLKGFKRVKNDRLLMFALRMNAKDEYGRRLAATYFDPGATRLHGGSGVSDGGERSKPIAPSPSGGTAGLAQPQRVGGGGGATELIPSSLRSIGQAGTSAAVGQQTLRVTESITGPAVTQLQKDARNAALVAQFDPVAMTLPEIEAMQAMLVDLAERKRAEEDGPPEHMTGVAFLQNNDEDAFKPLGPLEDLEPVVTEEDRETEFDAEEDRWWELGEGD